MALVTSVTKKLINNNSFEIRGLTQRIYAIARAIVFFGSWSHDIWRTYERKTYRTKNMGGLAPKFISPGFDGMPDRLVLMPKGKIAFAEVKAPDKTMRPLQIKRKRQLEALGFRVYCVDSTEQIGGILGEIQSS